MELIFLEKTFIFETLLLKIMMMQLLLNRPAREIFGQIAPKTF